MSRPTGLCQPVIRQYRDCRNLDKKVNKNLTNSEINITIYKALFQMWSKGCFIELVNTVQINLTAYH